MQWSLVAAFKVGAVLGVVSSRRPGADSAAFLIHFGERGGALAHTHTLGLPIGPNY